MLLAKIPVPPPSNVLEFVVVGPGDVLQQTPRDVTLAPPSDSMLPPLIAVLVVIKVGDVVDASVGITITAFVVKLISDAYDVPMLFVAYART